MLQGLSMKGAGTLGSEAFGGADAAVDLLPGAFW